MLHTAENPKYFQNQSHWSLTIKSHMLIINTKVLTRRYLLKLAEALLLSCIPPADSGQSSGSP